jgi:predicted oxidoreductase
MVDFAADSVVETYRNTEIKRKPWDPYGGGGEYYAMFGGEKTPMFKELDQLKKYLDNVINDEIATGDRARDR